MSEKEVKAVETAKFSDKIECKLFYEATVNNLDVIILYSFIDNKLVSSSYYVTETHSNKTEFIYDYEELKDVLINKYGEPDFDDIIWFADLFKDNPEHWGVAIATGDLAYQSVWENEKTLIFLSLQGDNYKISFNVVYKSIELKYLEEEKNKAKNTDDF